MSCRRRELPIVQNIDFTKKKMCYFKNISCCCCWEGGPAPIQHKCRIYEACTGKQSKMGKF